MATETRSPGTLASDSSNGGITSWTSASNAAASDNSYATTADGPLGESHYLKGTNYGFTTIQTTDTLTQLKIRIERKTTSGGPVKDHRLHFVIGGTIQTGTNYADTATAFTGSDAYAEYNITTGLPTITQLKNSGFGVAWSCKDSGSGIWGVSCDHMGEVEATYTPPPTFTATAACSAAHAAAAASCTFAPKCTASAAPVAAHATAAASMVFAASVGIATANPAAAHATGAASMSYTPPHFTASAAGTVGHAIAAALASSIYHASAAVITPHATCAAAMVYSDPIYAAAAPMTTRPATCEAAGQTWRRGAWRYQRVTVHKG